MAKGWSSEKMLHRLIFFLRLLFTFIPGSVISFWLWYFYIFIELQFSVKWIRLKWTDQYFFIVGSRFTFWIACLNIWLLVSDLIFTKCLILEALQHLWFSLFIQRTLCESELKAWSVYKNTAQAFLLVIFFSLFLPIQRPGFSNLDKSVICYSHVVQECIAALLHVNHLTISNLEF